MDLADIFRQFDTSDEDLKVAQVLGMRTFNAFGVSPKLAPSGYHQNSVILRDVLEPSSCSAFSSVTVNGEWCTANFDGHQGDEGGESAEGSMSDELKCRCRGQRR